MPTIVIADDGIEFDGQTPEHSPLGGAESAVISLAEALASRGNDVWVYNHCKEALDYKGVKWRPLSGGLPKTADLYVANRGDKLILAMPEAKRTVFWTHNPAGYMLKWRYMWKLWKSKVPVVFIGGYHASTYPSWAPGGERRVISYGLPRQFLEAKTSDKLPPARAIYTSNPLRGLDWLLDLWAEKIAPNVEDAELHVFSGPSTYGSAGKEKAARMQVVLDKALSLKDKGVVLRTPLPKLELIEEVRASRVLIYRGDINETFCLAVAEAQALGVPVVAKPIGSIPERVVDGKTGALPDSDADFAAAAVRILTDDAHWRKLHGNCLKTQRQWTWEAAAEGFESFLAEPAP